MAEGIQFICDDCGFEIWAWDEGNPYYVDRTRMLDRGLPRSKCKVHVFHPEVPPQPLDGNDVPHLCLECGHAFDVDTARNRTTCTKCRSPEILDCCRLSGRRCPECRRGSFRRGGSMIS